MLRSFIYKMQTQPQQLFLIDGVGALISAFLLGIILVQLEEIIGMPKDELYMLSFLAIGFAIYSLSCAWKTPQNWQIYLKAIAIINVSYCCLTLGLVFFHQGEVSTLGILYFIIEVIIVVSLAVIEFKVAEQ